MFYGANNGPLREGKGTVYEGGVRVPFTVSWPDVIPAGKDYDPMVSSLDIFATSVAVAKAHTSAERPLDGINLIPYLIGDNQQPPHEILFWRQSGGAQSAVRENDLKRVRIHGKVELNDLGHDLAERNNLSASLPEKLQHLQVRYQTWNSQLVIPLWDNPEPLKKNKK